MPLHKLLFGDKALASRWLGYAVQKLKLLHGRFNEAAYAPNTNTSIRVRRVGKQEYVYISVTGLLGYEFCNFIEVGTERFYGVDAKVGAVSRGQAIPEFKTLLNGVIHGGVDRAAYHHHIWGDDNIYVTAGLGKRYCDNSLVIYALYDNPFPFQTPITLPDEALYWPENTAPVIANLSSGAASFEVTTIECVAAALLNGVLICIDNFGVVKATLPVEGAVVKTIPVSIPVHNGVSTIYWTFNKTGDSAVAVVSSIVDNYTPPDPEDYTRNTAVVKLDFTAALSEDGSDFTVTAAASTVFHRLEGGSTIDSFGADFYYDEEGVEHVVIGQSRAYSDDLYESTVYADKYAVLDVNDLANPLMEIPLLNFNYTGRNHTNTIVLDVDLRHLAAVTLTWSNSYANNIYGSNSKGLQLRAYYEGQQVEEVSIGGRNQEVDTTGLLIHPDSSLQGAWLYAHIGFEALARITTADNNVWAVYAAIPETPSVSTGPGSFITENDYSNMASKLSLVMSSIEFPTEVVGPIELDVVSYGTGKTSHRELYNSAVASYTPTPPDPVDIEPLPEAYQYLIPDDNVQLAVNGNWYKGR